MPQPTTPQAEPASMDEVISGLQKPFEFPSHSDATETSGSEITPDSDGRAVVDPKLQPPTPPAPPATIQKAPETPVEKPKETGDKPDSRSVLESLSKIGEKNIELGKPQVKTPETTPPSQPHEPPKPGERDYSGFSEREAQLLKRMSNESFDFVAKEIRESRAAKAKFEADLKVREEELNKLKEGKVTIPENYYENPEAVVLTPEFRSAQEGYVLAQQVEDHWAIQLARLEKGENWTDLDNDPKTGAIVYGKTNDPSPESRAYIQRQLSGAQQQTFRVGEGLKNIVDGFKTRSQEYRERIRTAEKTYMPFFEDEASEPHKRYKTVLPEIKQLGISETNPAYTILAKSIALNMILNDELLKIKAQQSRQETIKQDMKKAGPSAADFEGAPPNNLPPAPAKKLTFSQMDQALRNMA